MKDVAPTSDPFEWVRPEANQRQNELDVEGHDCGQVNQVEQLFQELNSINTGEQTSEQLQWKPATYRA